MPSTAILRPQIPLQPSFTSASSISESKWRPSIESASVISFEKRKDQKIWYLVKITPNKCNHVTFKSYLIARRYEDFAQLSHDLHDRFNTIKHRANFQLPPKIKNTRLNLLGSSKQMHAQRINELNEYLSLLFRNPSLITESRLVADFFDILVQDFKYQDSKKQVEEDDDSKSDMKGSTSRWKRLRCTSFLARAPQPSLSSLCSQAASKIIPSRHRSSTAESPVPQPSISTPTSHPLTTTCYPRNTILYNKDKLKKSKSNVCIGSHLSSFEHSKQLKDTIKIKVIYDVNNIIVIQVARTITLTELRSRIADKFSDQTCPQNEIVLLYNDSMSSYCSTTSNSSNHTMSLPAILINKEQDLAHLMQNKWNRLEKVTLRCIM